VIWFPRAIGLLTLLYGISALMSPRPIARHAELDDPASPGPAVRILSATVGIRDIVSGAAILAAPCGGVLVAALGARVAFDAGDAAVFGRLSPTPAARRKIAAIALGWGSISAVSMAFASC
jgi:hypothetical protein